MEQRLRFEMLLADVCAQFVNVTPSELNSKIESAQRAICESLGVNHSSVWQVSEDDPDLLVMTHTYRDLKLKPLPTRPIINDYFPWSWSRIRSGEIVSVPSTEKVPPEAAKDRESWLQYGVRSTLAFPLSVGGGSVIGLLAFDSTEEREWSEPLKRRLQILALVFAQALDRKKSEQKVKMAQDALRASEERLRLALHAACIGTFEWNIRTGVNTWTPELEALYGLPPGGFGGTQTAFEDLVHPDDRARVIELDNWALKTGQPTKGEWRIVWADGSIHWIAGRWQVYTNESGQPARMVGVNIDVTQHKMAEDRLREYEEAVEGAEDMIGIIDRQYRFVLANRQYLKMRNLTREQVVGHFVTEVLSKEIFETAIKPRLDECFQGRVVRYEMKFSYPTAGERDLLLSYFPITGVNRVDRVACILHDITDRKRAEEALLEMNRTLEAQGSLLRSREELLTIFVRNVPTGAAMLDRDMRYLQVSDRWCADYSILDSSQVLGRSHYELFPDIPERWKQVHRRALEGETVRADEDRWDREGGGTTWVRWEVRPWHNLDGLPGGILIFSEDITERKRAEEARSTMSRKLIEAQEQERNRIGRDLHDDIGQRLALLAIELEQMRLAPPDTSDEVSSRMDELWKQTSEISTDVQALSHELHSSRLEYLGIVAAMRSFCKEFGEQRRMEVEFKGHDLPSPSPSPEISLSLFRVLQEALHNAAKHSGVRHFEVQLCGAPAEIHLTVSDSGAGFDTEAVRKGRGLGLTSMEERLKLVNGELSIDSQPKRGTTIHARVPLSLNSDSMRAIG